MAELRGGLQDHEPQALLGQVPGHGQPGLAPTDHHHIQLLLAGLVLLRLAVGAVMEPPPARGPR
jgi:hypothetical protein